MAFIIYTHILLTSILKKEFASLILLGFFKAWVGRLE